MKEMNRREFLTLTGAAVVALSLAGCGGTYAPPAPPAAPPARKLSCWQLSTRSGRKSTMQRRLSMSS